MNNYIIHKTWDFGNEIIKLFEDPTVTTYGGTDKGHFYWSNVYDKNERFLYSASMFISALEGIEFYDKLCQGG